MQTNIDIAREFCRGAFQKTFNLSDTRTEEYAKVIAELLDYAVANAEQERVRQMAGTGPFPSPLAPFEFEGGPF